MIIDSLDLTPRRGRLLSPTNQSDLSVEKLGGFGPVADGVAYSISGLHVYFEMSGLEELLASSQTELFRLETRKEVAPGLVLDPYSHRMHSVAGREDFVAGHLTNGRIEAVDGRDVLCALDGQILDWLSATYRLRQPASCRRQPGTSLHRVTRRASAMPSPPMSGPAGPTLP